MRASIFVLPLTSFAIILVAMLGFAELADGIGPNENLHLFDKRVAAALQIERASAIYTAFGLATHLGSGALLAVLGIAAGAVLIVKREFMALYAGALALSGSGLLNHLLKAGFERLRPGDVPLLSTWSFPSGHAMNSLVAYGMLSYLVWRLGPREWRLPIAASAIVIVLIVGLSRILLGYHYFTDVIGGYAAGLAWLTVCTTVLELGLRRRAWKANTRAAKRP